MRTLTNSALQCFHSCHKKYDIQYRHRCRPIVEAAPLTIGTAFHSWVETGIVPCLDDDDARCLVWAMIKAYSCHYQDDAPLDFMAKEQTIKAPLRNPSTGMPSRTFTRAGKCDGVVRRDGGLLLYELKTTGVDIDTVVSQLRRGTQLATYAGIYREQYPDQTIDGAIVDVVRKPRLKRRKDEDDGEYANRLAYKMLEDKDTSFRRELLPWSEQLIDETDQLYWDTAKLIRYCDKHGYTAARGAHCKSFFGGCEYRRLCWYSINDGYRISDKEHEEL